MSTKNTLNTKLNVKSNSNILNLGITRPVSWLDEKPRHRRLHFSFLKRKFRYIHAPRDKILLYLVLLNMVRKVLLDWRTLR